MFRYKIQSKCLRLALLLQLAATFTVYDCEHEKTATQVLDLLEPESCRNPHQDYEPPKVQRMQIAQVGARTSIDGYRCKATITKKVTRCGFDSITYGDQYPAFERLLDITPSQCREASLTGLLTLQKRTYKVKVGTQTVINEFSHGRVLPNGHCETTTFISEDQIFTNSYEMVMIHIDIGKLRGIIDAADNSVRFSNGLKANSNDEVIRDDYEGIIVWHRPQPNCSDSISGIYIGNVTMHYINDANTILGSLVMLTSPEVHQYAGLILTAPRTLCSAHCYQTNIKGIVVCLLREHDLPVLQGTFRNNFEELDTDLRNQMSFLHLRSGLDSKAQFMAVHTELCRLDRVTKQLKLQAIAGANNLYSLLDIYGKGHTLYKAGAVVYISKCVPVDATIAHHQNCTTEIPVIVNNAKRFADPFTWIVKDYPQELPCSDIMPVRWQVNTRWLCSTPTVVECKPPSKLNLNDKFVVTSDITTGLDGSIYTVQQQRQHLMFIRSSSGREAVWSRATAAAVMNTKPNGQLGLPLTSEDLLSLVEHLNYVYLPFFHYIGNAYITLVGVFVVLSGIKTIVSWILRGHSLVQTRGVGIHLIGIVSEAFYRLVMGPQEVGLPVPPLGQVGIILGQPNVPRQEPQLARFE